MTDDNHRPGDAELPTDPDCDDVPTEWRAVDGLTLTTRDENGNPETGTIDLQPGAFGEARRRAEGFYNGGDDA